MPDIRIKELVDQRVALESRLKNETSELSDSRARVYDHEYSDVQKKLAALFKETQNDSQRIAIMLELMRILENRLVYLHNFTVDATSDNRVLAQLVAHFIDELASDNSTVLTKLESTDYRRLAANQLPLIVDHSEPVGPISGTRVDSR